LAGVLKIVLRLVDLRVFRNLRPLEEESATNPTFSTGGVTGLESQ
jgi:hypothetical protein